MDEQRIRRQKPNERRLPRHLCRLEAETDVTAVIRDINARGAFLETSYRPPLGSKVRLRHRPAGLIEGEVSGHSGGGVAISFAGGAGATAFALAVIASGMTDRAA